RSAANIGIARRLGALDHEAGSKAVCFRQRRTKLRPAVEKIRGIVSSIEKVFSLARGLDAFVTRLDPVAGRETGDVSKNTAEHWSDFELQILTERKIVSDPNRSGLERLIVVARFEMQPVIVGGEIWIAVVARMLREISVSRQSKFPFWFVLFVVATFCRSA